MEMRQQKALEHWSFTVYVCLLYVWEYGLDLVWECVLQDWDKGWKEKIILQPYDILVRDNIDQLSSLQSITGSPADLTFSPLPQLSFAQSKSIMDLYEQTL